MAFTFKRIVIDFVPQTEQRYATVGDYGEKDDVIWFKITRLSGLRSIYALIHEIWEKFRKDRDGVSDEAVDAFDMSHPELDDPGLSREALYHKQHMESDVLERACCVMAGDDWVDYEAEINRLFEVN
jgi:hypothetical protein